MGRGVSKWEGGYGEGMKGEGLEDQQQSVGRSFEWNVASSLKTRWDSLGDEWPYQCLMGYTDGPVWKPWHLACRDFFH